MAGDSVEPWLRGPLAEVNPLVGPTLYAYTQAREDIAHWTDGLSDAGIWLRPQGLAPIGFQLRHIAGSVDRLTTYLRAEQLTPRQLEALRSEMNPGPGLTVLLAQVNAALDNSEEFIRTLDPATLAEPRTVGRKQLPTTVIGLVVHLAEHTQRHVGQLIVTSKIVRAMSTSAATTADDPVADAGQQRST